MSEFDYFEALNMAYSGIPVSAMNFIYLVFAYIVASYLAGKAVPGYIAVAASFVYTLSLIGPLAGVLSGIAQCYQVLSEYRLAFPDGRLIRPQASFSTMAYVVALSPLVIGWVASLLFLHLFIRSDSNNIPAINT